MFNLSEIQMQILWIKNFLGENFSAVATFFPYLILGYIFRLFVLRWSKKFTKPKKLTWHDFFESLANPIFFFFVFKGLFSAIDKIGFIHQLIKDYIINLNKSVVVLTIFWFVISYLIAYEKRLKKNKYYDIAGFDKTAIKILVRISKAIIVLITIMIMMNILGIDIRAILTITGIGGAAIGFASKDLFANFLGSIILFVDKPFVIGDWIKLANNREGRVEKIGWRVTKLRTQKTSCIYIANSFFSTMLVENYSKMTHRIISKIIILKCLDTKKISNITKIIRETLAKHPEIDSSKEIDCFVSEFKSDSVTCKINAFTTTNNKIKFLELEQQILFELAKITSKQKIHMLISD